MKKMITDSFSRNLITSCSEIKNLCWSGPLTVDSKIKILLIVYANKHCFQNYNRCADNAGTEAAYS